MIALIKSFIEYHGPIATTGYVLMVIFAIIGIATASLGWMCIALLAAIFGMLVELLTNL